MVGTGLGGKKGNFIQLKMIEIVYFILHGISLLVLILGTLENIFDQGGHLEYGTYFDKRAKKYIA